MADITKKYPQKLGRFNSGKCFDLYYSEPIGYGTYDSIVESAESGVPIGYIYLEFNISSFEGWMGNGGRIFSSGIISGKIVSYTAPTLTIMVNKDSFETLDAFDNFLTKHSGINYNFEVLESYNHDDGNVKNSVLYGINIHEKKRINNYPTYSPYGFVYNKDFYYELTTKTFVMTDLSQIDDILRAGSFVVKSTDESYIRSGALDNSPAVLGVSGETADIISQPYFGGVQDNEWYRAQMIDSEFVWDNGRYKGKLKFKITG